MKIKILLSFLLIILLNINLYSQEIMRDSQSESREIALVTRIIKNSTTQQMQQVWPGYNMRTSPMIITFSNGHIYAYNLRSNSPEWKRNTYDGIEILYTNQDKWGIMTAPMQFNFAIEGQEAFIFRLDMMEGPVFMPFFVMVHERFHVHQIKHFASERRNAESEYPESSNVDNLSLMQLEELILLDFLKALQNDSQSEIISNLKTYISVNQKRRQLLSPISQEWEARQQMVEGLADYVAAKNLDVFEYFGKKTGQKHLLVVMERYTKDDDITSRALKWRHYGVGSSIGYALDYLQVQNWKREVENDVSLQILLERRLSVNNTESAQLFQKAIEKYNFSDIRKTVEKKINDYNKMINDCIVGFQKQPGVIFNIQSPPDSGLSAGGHSKGVYSLPDGSMLSVLDTSKTSSADNFWNLELRSIPYLFQTNNGFRRLKVSSNDIEIIIDGKRYALEQVGQRPFRQLSIRSNSCNFKSIQNPGKIVYHNNELSVIYHDTGL